YDDGDDPASGLLWMARALEQAPDADDGLQHAIRANLAACRRRNVGLKSVLDSFGPAIHMLFSPDGKMVLTVSQDGTARLGRAPEGAPVGPPLNPPGPALAAVDAVAFSPDGKTALTGSADGTARLWDAADGAPVGPPLEHQGWVGAVAFSPD